MPTTARILKDHTLNSEESLVLLLLTTDDETKECITIAGHPAGGGITSFRATELVTAIDKDLVWMRRTMFRGRSANVLINENRAITLNARKITILKSKSPEMSKEVQ